MMVAAEASADPIARVAAIASAVVSAIALGLGWVNSRAVNRLNTRQVEASEKQAAIQQTLASLELREVREEEDAAHRGYLQVSYRKSHTALQYSSLYLHNMGGGSAYQVELEWLDVEDGDENPLLDEKMFPYAELRGHNHLELRCLTTSMSANQYTLKVRWRDHDSTKREVVQVLNV